MSDLRWSWLGVPYFGCAAMLVAVAIATALIRGDRVLRIGMIGAAMAAVPWALSQGLATLTLDAALALRVLRVGQGPVALVGPCLLLVLLGVSGQLERHRWTAWLAGVVGTAFVFVTWFTSWVVPAVQVVPAGIFYISPGPLTGIHNSLLVLWIFLGVSIARRSAPRAESRRTMRLVIGVAVFGAIGFADMLLLYRIWGVYPIAWLPATISASIALYLVVRTDLLRPQGFDRDIGIEVAGFALAIGVTAVLVVTLRGASPITLAAVASLVWATITAAAWALVRSRPVRVAAERALELFLLRVASVDDEQQIADRLGGLWRRAVGIELRALWWMEDGTY